MSTPHASRPVALPASPDQAAWDAIRADVAALPDEGLCRLLADAAVTAAGPHTSAEYDAALACLLAGAEEQQRRGHPDDTPAQVRLRATAQVTGILSDAVAVRLARRTAR